jgi:hypothetical protein
MKSFSKKLLLLLLIITSLFVSFFYTIKEGMTDYVAPRLVDLTGFVFFVKGNEVNPEVIVEIDKLKAKGPFVRVENCTKPAVHRDYDVNGCQSGIPTAQLYKKGQYVKDYNGPMKMKDFIEALNKLRNNK